MLVECLTNNVLLEDDSSREPRPVATIGAPGFDRGEPVGLLVTVHPLTAFRLDEVEAIGRQPIRATAGLG